MALRSKGVNPVCGGVALLLLWCGTLLGDLDDAAFLESDENQVPIHEAVAKEIGIEVPKAVPITGTAPLPVDANAWSEMKVRGKPVTLGTVSFKAFREVGAAGVEKVQGFSSLSDTRDTGALLKNLIVGPLNAETDSLVAALRPFRPQKLARVVEAHWALSPIHVWRGGSLGKLRLAADQAVEDGEVTKADALKARYWKWLEIAMERRAVFEQSAASERGTGVAHDGGQ